MTAKTAPEVSSLMVAHAKARYFLLIWLGCVGFLVASMIVLGGVTRLTESGLSMVDWRPVTGWLPPLSEDAWRAEFERYRAFPEYQKVNRGMSLAEFQFIFAFEYAHRILGRLVGLAFALPLGYILLRGWVRADLRNRLILLFFLGGLQGVIGWWMVKSGLVDRPDVSHYRLASHLGLALIILSYLYWLWLGLYKKVDQFRPIWGTGRIPLAGVLYCAVFLQIITGAFVAGLSAGETYNTWPLMDGRFVPEHYWLYEPVWMAPLAHISAIQFNHRFGAYVLVAFVIWIAYRHWQTRYRRWVMLLALAVTGQALLGIVTLLLVVPISLGALHQFGAVFVLVVAIGYWHALVYGE